jgi:hypothetical protein
MFNKIFFLRLKHEPSKKSGPSCDHWQPHQPVDLLGGTTPGGSLRSHHLPACLPGIVFAIINQWIYWVGMLLGGVNVTIIYPTSLPSRCSLHNHQPEHLQGGTAPGRSLRSHHLPACLPGIVFTTINQWIYWEDRSWVESVQPSSTSLPSRYSLHNHQPVDLLGGPLLGGVCAAIIYQLAFQV